MDSSGSLHLLWAVRQQHLIYFEVTPPSEYPDSWIAVGFSDRGDLTNADYCFMWTDYNGKLRIQVSLNITSLVFFHNNIFFIILIKTKCQEKGLNIIMSLLLACAIIFNISNNF